MTVPTSDTEPLDATTDTESETNGAPHRNRRLLWAALALIVAVAVALVVAWALNDDDSTTSAPVIAPTTSSPATSATTAPSTTVVTAPADTSTAVWPPSTSSVRYDDPVAAATGFASDFLGFRSPVASEYIEGDSRSGEVEITPNSTGPVTTVFVRQLGSDSSWWVLGSATNNIRLTTPTALDSISSPVHLTGTSTAFEANVTVFLYQDGHQPPLVSSFVMGGANGEFAPFDAMLEFPSAQSERGTLVLLTQSMEDGSTWEASVTRVQFSS